MEQETLAQLGNSLSKAQHAISRVVGGRIVGLRYRQQLDFQREEIQHAVDELYEARRLIDEIAQELPDQEEAIDPAEAIRVRAHKRVKTRKPRAGEDESGSSPGIPGDTDEAPPAELPDDQAGRGNGGPFASGQGGGIGR